MRMTKKELVHGAVLAQIVRGGQRPALRMIETNLDKNASSYRINDEVLLHVVFRTSKNGQSWSFQFKREKLEYLKSERCYVALVCSSNSLDTVEDTDVCFLTPEELSEVYGLDDLGSAKSRSVTVRRERNKWLRVISQPRGISKAVPRSALKKWKIPGS